MFPKMSAYRGVFEKTKYVFFDKNDELQEKYNEIWGKVSKVIQEEIL